MTRFSHEVWHEHAASLCFQYAGTHPFWHPTPAHRMPECVGGYARAEFAHPGAYPHVEAAGYVRELSNNPIVDGIGCA
ncbi:MAG TPA: hypothetical protein VEX68_05890 [Bryobacteraceae bacterium]|nr:hypothetical protein [Bryobacteraceae bacterium]